MDGEEIPPSGYEFGIDIGGTFTDVVCRAPDGSIQLTKMTTTRGNPSRAVLAALVMARSEWRVPPASIARFVHGTTVATNAVLERRGARIGLITTEGFRDVIEIGRQMRHQMYDLVLQPETLTFLAPGARRKEVAERLDAHGRVLRPLDEASVHRALDELLPPENVMTPEALTPRPRELDHVSLSCGFQQLKLADAKSAHTADDQARQFQ